MYKMAFTYPEFNGGPGEEVTTFLEQMEIACISNHIVEPASMLRLLQIFIKGDARVWLKDFEAQQQEAEPPVPVTVELIKEALKTRYQRVEDPDKVWHTIQSLKQGETEPIESFVKWFTKLWDLMCTSLWPEQPPAMMKKDSFIASLKNTLRWRVELKKPPTYDEAVDIAKNKEWKVQRMHQLGMGTSEARVEPRKVEVVPVVTRGVIPVT